MLLFVSIIGVLWENKIRVGSEKCDDRIIQDWTWKFIFNYLILNFNFNYIETIWYKSSRQFRILYYSYQSNINFKMFLRNFNKTHKYSFTV